MQLFIYLNINIEIPLLTVPSNKTFRRNLIETLYIE